MDNENTSVFIAKNITIWQKKIFSVHLHFVKQTHF